MLSRPIKTLPPEGNRSFLVKTGVSCGSGWAVTQEDTAVSMTHPNAQQWYNNATVPENAQKISDALRMPGRTRLFW